MVTIRTQTEFQGCLKGRQRSGAEEVTVMVIGTVEMMLMTALMVMVVL